MIDDKLREIEERLAEAVKKPATIETQRIYRDTDRLIQWLREAREENTRLRDGLSSIAAQPTGTTTYGYDEDADWDACEQCCIIQDIARAALGGKP